MVNMLLRPLIEMHEHVYSRDLERSLKLRYGWYLTGPLHSASLLRGLLISMAHRCCVLRTVASVSNWCVQVPRTSCDPRLSSQSS